MSKLAAIPRSPFQQEYENEPPYEPVEYSEHLEYRAELEADLKIKVAEFENLFSEFRENIQRISPEFSAGIGSVLTQLERGAVDQYSRLGAEAVDIKHQNFKFDDFWEQYDRQTDTHIAELKDDIDQLFDEVTSKDDFVTEIRRRMQLAKAEYDRRARELHQTTEKLTKQTVRINDKVFAKQPLLSDAAKEYFALRREMYKDQQKEIGYLEHRLMLFLEICGDKRLDEYSLSDLSKYAVDLKYIPANLTKRSKWNRRPIREIIEIHKKKLKISNKQDWVSLTSRTIKVNYVGRMKTIFNYLLADNNLPNPFHRAKVVIPDTNTDSIIRLPLSVNSINALFRGCSQLSRPDDALLPLLGALTGARISELAFLQSKDIVAMDGHYVANLFGTVTTGDGQVRRNLKTKQSKRYIALHQELVELGFVDWAQAQKGFLFPHLHQPQIVRPADTASKRFQRIFRKLKIHSQRAEVFHSLRHFYKDLLREGGIDERTMDIQTGHAPTTIGRRYGSQVLRPKEIAAIATVPLPKTMSLEPYRDFDYSALEQFDAKEFARQQRMRRRKIEMKKLNEQSE